MALRSRVPNRKTLSGGHRHRNKNPKLSPFQREQRRTRLANQPPTRVNATSTRDYPKSARGLMEYLQRRSEREALRKENATGTSGSGKSNGGGAGGGAEVRSVAAVPAAPATSAVKKSKNKFALREVTASSASLPHVAEAQSLNSELRPSAVSRIDEEQLARIQRKKQKKHAKKLAAKLEKRMHEWGELEAQLKEEALTPAKKKMLKRKKERDVDPVEAETKRLEQLNAERERQKRIEAAAAAALATAIPPPSAAAAAATAAAAPQKRKRITFDATVEAPGDDEHRPMRYPGDVRSSKAPEKTSLAKSADRLFGFEERVDVVRFGERVEAPPVFDKLPKAGAMSELGTKLLQQDGVYPALSAKRARLEQVSAVKGSQLGLYEHKRLTKLGLIDAATQQAPLHGRDGAGGTAARIALSAADKQSEMERLRAQVMASYRKGKGAAARMGNGPTLFKHSYPTDA